MKIFVSGKLFELEEATVKWRPEHVLAKLCKKQLEQKQDVSAYPNAVDITLPNRPSNDLGLIRSPDAEIEASTAATRSEHITVHGRSTDAFKAIMTYYQTGRLHIPLCMCIGAFKDEMDYWGISTSELTECCLYKYHAFKEDQKTRCNFLLESPVLPKKNDADKGSCYPRLRAVTSRIWSVVDNADKSLGAKLYFGLVIAMVILSIITMALSTEPLMRRKASHCEILEYMEYTDSEDTDLYREHLGYPVCGSYFIFLPLMTFSNQKEEEQEEENDETSDKFGVNTDTHNLVFSTTTTTLESATQTTSFEPTELTEETPSTGDHAAKTRENQAQTAAYINWTIPAPINWTIPTPIKWTIPAPINWTIPTIEENILPVVYGDDVIVTSRGTLIHVPNLTVPVFSLDVLESIALLFFSCDLLLRLVTCPSLKLFCVSVINILDACALASNIAYGFIVHFKREYRYMETRWLDVLTCMQIFRSIRLFRLVKNVRTGKILLYSIRKNVGDFLFLALLLCVGIGMFASLFYFVETRETVYSIPMAWYWSVITMTTIGYGDVAPSTCLGRVVASLCVTGVIMLAISLPMFVNSFIKLNKYASLSESIENETHSSASPHV